MDDHAYADLADRYSDDDDEEDDEEDEEAAE